MKNSFRQSDRNKPQDGAEILAVFEARRSGIEKIQRRRRRAAGTILGVLLAVSITAFAGELENNGAARFKVTIKSKVTMKNDGSSTEVDAETSIAYHWRIEALERTLFLNSLAVMARIDRSEAVNTTMSRDLVTNTREGKTEEISFENAPEALKKTMKASFDAPLCRITVDADGRETARTLLAGDDAKGIMDNGIVAGAALFHPPFPSGKDEWQADAEISMGGGNYGKGKLTYKKVEGGRDGQLVKVSGTLTKEDFKKQGTPYTVTGVKYVVDGEETYDPAKREWSSGHLSIQVEFRLMTDKKETGSALGTMTVDFERLSGK